jgi:hypothetical protein
MATATTARRDVEAFKTLLWRWFEAEEYRREWSKFQAPGAKEAEASATQALEVVLKAFEAEPDDASLKAAFRQSLETGNLHPDLDNPTGRNVVNFLRILADFPPKTQQPLPPPQNSRDSDFP